MSGPHGGGDVAGERDSGTARRPAVAAALQLGARNRTRLLAQVEHLRPSPSRSHRRGQLADGHARDAVDVDLVVVPAGHAAGRKPDVRPHRDHRTRVVGRCRGRRARSAARAGQRGEVGGRSRRATTSRSVPGKSASRTQHPWLELQTRAGRPAAAIGRASDRATPRRANRVAQTRHRASRTAGRRERTSPVVVGAEAEGPRRRSSSAAVELVTRRIRDPRAPIRRVATS